MRSMTPAVSLAILLGALLLNSWPAIAQDTYPLHPVKIVLSLPPGSAPDIRARIIGNELTKIWGHQVVIENRAGAGGALSVQAVLSAPADGYTLLSAVSSVFTVLPAQRTNLRFDVNRDLVPIAMTGGEGMVLAVSPKLGVNSLAEFIALAKAQPEKLIIGTNPAGSLPHLAARLFVSLANAPVTVVPYSSGGTNEAIKRILGGQIHGVIEARQGLKAHLELGRFESACYYEPGASEHRSRFADRSGNRSRAGGNWLYWNSWTKGIPDDIVQRLAASIRQALETPEVKDRLEQTGTPFRPLFTSDFARFIEAEQKLWWPVVKEAGL